MQQYQEYNFPQSRETSENDVDYYRNDVVADTKNLTASSILKRQKRINWENRIISEMEAVGISQLQINKMKKIMPNKKLGLSDQSTEAICNFIRYSHIPIRKLRQDMRQFGLIKDSSHLYRWTTMKKIQKSMILISRREYRQLYKEVLKYRLMLIHQAATKKLATLEQLKALLTLKNFLDTLKGLFRSARIQALQILEQKFLNEFNGNQLEFQQYINQLLSQKKLIEKKILKGKTYNQARTTLPSFDFTACYFIRQKTHLIQLRQRLHKGADWPIINLQFPNNQQHQILHENHQPINQQPVYDQQSESSSYLPIQTFIIPYVPQDVEIDFDQFNHIYNHDSSDI